MSGRSAACCSRCSAATHAFPGSDITEVLATVLKSEPEWNTLPATVPARVRAVLGRCLQKDPKLRFRDIGDVRLALDGAFETMAAAPVPAAAPAPRRSVLWPVAVVGVALVAAGADVVHRPSGSRTHGGEAVFAGAAGGRSAAIRDGNDGRGVAGWSDDGVSGGA